MKHFLGIWSWKWGPWGPQNSSYHAAAPCIFSCPPTTISKQHVIGLWQRDKHDTSSFQHYIVVSVVGLGVGTSALSEVEPFDERVAPSLSIYLSIYLYLSTYLSISLSLYLSLSLYIYIYIYTYTHISIRKRSCPPCGWATSPAADRPPRWGPRSSTGLPGGLLLSLLLLVLLLFT